MARARREATPQEWAKRHNAALFLAGDGRAPSFGYFPNARQRTTMTHLTAQAAPYEYAVELRLRDHAVLAFEYRTGEQTAGTGHMVQTWTPPVPALSFDTSLKSMLATIKRPTTTFQAPGTVATGYPPFDDRFTVYCEHPDFARGVLTPQVVQWLLGDPRTPGQFALLNSVALTSGTRRLVLDDVDGTAGFLVDFVCALPGYTWQYRP
ncbi:hypothetical protein [Amycolatopsis sp. H20-H5]|uniref:hypothetical protein n=1 Tax=Amycolatopsis sp. H20-H5 TaxID=3046309 RepID=UPI002DB5F692|nr:hypothetical protein [Amycolatopsis sp. H20-H5]MEC3979164.1 hypothetical protein [Amycolatopsis sp. H20-H5]